jgi:hypothetical protein
VADVQQLGGVGAGDPHAEQLPVVVMERAPFGLTIDYKSY